ncbi:MAG: family 1 glycosylhydrolase [Candidatus Binatia bacterium]
MRYLVVLAALVLSGTSAWGAFPAGFGWGTAVAGFQVDMGGAPASRDPRSDWWSWVHDPGNIAAGRVSGDLPENGPDEYDLFATDAKLAARRLRNTTLRVSLEWSRLFPTSTAGVDASGGITPGVLAQLDALADAGAVAHYRTVLAELRARGLAPFVTLNHFSLPLWAHDPIAARDALAGIDPNGPLPTGFGPAGWLDPATVTEFAKYAAWAGWKFGDLVDLWSPLNEPLVVATSGYVNLPGVLSGNFPPGAFTFTGAIAVILNEAAAQAAAYDALRAHDTIDADGDGAAAVVGIVHNMAAFHPKNPALASDVAGAAHAEYLFNRLFLNAVILGDVDVNANGTIDPGEHQPGLAGKADFIGVNYYLRATATGLGASVTPVIPVLDFLPTIAYQTPHNPAGGACPSVCTEFGWEIYPTGLREVLATAGGYGLPVYVTENGIADADDDQRAAYLVQHLAVLERAIADGVADVRGYYHWSLVDNFEWSSGYYPKFGLFAFDAATRRRHARRSGRYYARIARGNTVPARLQSRFGP